MMTEGPYYLRERIRIARENLITFVFGAIGLGIVIGLATEALSAFVLQEPFSILILREHSWWYPLLLFVVFILLTVAGAIYFIRLIYAKGYDAVSFIEVVLPFRITPTEAEIVIAKPYTVTHKAHQLLEWMLEDENTKKQFLRDWQQASKEGKLPFQGCVRQCVLDLLEYVVLDVLREYTEITLSSKAIYTTKHGWKEIKPRLRKLSLNEWPTELKDNICFRDTRKPVFKQLQLPEGVILYMNERKRADQAEKREIVLDSDFGRLSFSLSPYPQRVSDRSREGTILRKYCEVSEKLDLWPAKFPLRITADFGGFSVLTKKFRESFLSWAEDLFQFVKNELDWSYCTERDLERMVVELREQVKALLKHQADSVIERVKGD